jgi:hypothetical protein
VSTYNNTNLDPSAGCVVHKHTLSKILSPISIDFNSILLSNLFLNDQRRVAAKRFCQPLVSHIYRSNQRPTLECGYVEKNQTSLWKCQNFLLSGLTFTYKKMHRFYCYIFLLVSGLQTRMNLQNSSF